MTLLYFMLAACGEKSSNIEETGFFDDSGTTEDSGSIEDTSTSADSGSSSPEDSGTETTDPSTTDNDGDGVLADSDCDDENPWTSNDCERACVGNFEIQIADDLALVAGCQSIDGDLNITGIDQNDMIALHSLESITGELWFFSIENLQSFHGLENLHTIGGGMIISYNNALTSLNGLDALQNVGGTLSITGNSLLADISSLNTLQMIGGTLLLDRLAIENLTAFSNLTTVGESIYVSNCANITSLVDVASSLESFGASDVIGTYDPSYGLIESLLYVYNNESLCDSAISTTTTALQSMGWEGRTVSFSNGTCQ